MFNLNKKKEDPLATLRNRIEGQPYQVPADPAPAPAAVKQPKGSKSKLVNEIWDEAHPETMSEQGQAAPVEAVKPATGGNGKKNGNRHKDGAGSPFSGTVPMGSQDTTPKYQEPAARANKDDLEAELKHQKLMQEIEQEAKIPGNGWLFNIKDKHLPEATVLDRGEVLAFALGFMQENMLNEGRTESLFASFAKDVMRMNVSVKGLSREQGLMARQQDADKNATLNTAKDLMGRPGAL